MTKTGKIIIRSGKHRVFKNGSIAVFDNEALCPECCVCKPFTLATFTTTNNATWHLTEYYNKDHLAPSMTYWRLINNHTSYVPIRQGCVNNDGRMVNLPSSISPDSYKYTWVFRLEIGCKETTGNYINWPNGSRSNIFSC